MVGESLHPIAHVVASASPRAIETAVAMGFAVDNAVDLPSGYLSGVIDHHEQWRWPAPYRRYADLLQRSITLAAVAELHRIIWTRIVKAVPDGAAALVIGHGGGIEPGLVACLPHADHQSWGAPFADCDGVRLSFDHDRFVGIQFHRAHGLCHELPVRCSTASSTRSLGYGGDRLPGMR
jgi:hypothetical protein